MKADALRDAHRVREYYLNTYTKGIVGHLDADHYIFVRFEDLISHNLTVRRSALRRILRFVTVPGTVFSDADLERGFTRGEAEHRPPPSSNEITYEETILSTPGLVEKYWSILGNATTTLGGYAQFKEKEHRSVLTGDSSQDRRLLSPLRYEEWGT